MDIKIKQQVNPEFLKIFFDGIPKNNITVGFWEEKLRPFFLKIDGVKLLSRSSDYGNNFAQASIELISREKTHSVIAHLKQLKPQLEDLFGQTVTSVCYKELPISDYL